MPLILAVVMLLPSEQALASCPPRTAQWAFQGSTHASSIGFSEAGLGDVNNDSFDDLIISASGFNGSQGAVYVFSGSANGLATTPFWTVLGEGGGFGYGVALAGDVNGDSYPDILVSAPGLEIGQGGVNRGRVYLFPGGPTGPSSSASWTFSGTFNFQQMGHKIAGAGDVNHDGFDDVLVSSATSNNGGSDGGQVFLFYGSQNGLSPTPAWTMEADRSNARFGWAIAGIGDVNADTFDDVAIASTWYDEDVHGRVFVFHGSPAGLPTSLSSAWSVAEPPTFFAPEFGESVAGAGDVNNDGFADLVVGAPYHGNPLPEEGIVFLYLGSASGLSNQPAWHTSSNSANARLGYSVAGIGDFNGDGFDDIAAGAYLLVDDMNVRRGGFSVFLGNPSGLSASPFFCALGDKQEAQLGFSLASAGDVNHDGYSDVVVGSPGFTVGKFVVGKVHLFHGESSPLIFSDGFESGNTGAWTGASP